MKYETVIGLEVHAQLLTKSKMFCGCSADYASTPPNTHVCPVCLGMPGVLPVINRQAVEYTMMTALALQCTVSAFTKFDRKNYNYPDLMKGYQISQYDEPIGLGGWLEIEADGQRRRIGITRVHLEEDTAKLSHRSGLGGEFSLVDVNRAGCPLMEIVGEPDLRSPEETRQYLIKLRGILQYLGVSTGNMEEGSFRCDANISVRPEGSDRLGVKVEIKNMNSFRAVFLAMEFEAARQRKALEDGTPIVQETRGWVEEQGRTVSQRTKEYAHDYRYFPEPDLPPMIISREWVDEVRGRLPELADARRERFMEEFGLPRADAEQLTVSKPLADYFQACVARPPQSGNRKDHCKLVANWILGEFSRHLNASGVDFDEMAEKIRPDYLVELLEFIGNGTINQPSAKAVLEEMYRSSKSAGDIIAARGLSQISDTSELEKIAVDVINSNVQPAADYRAGKEAALKFLVGQVMKATRGRANPQVVNDVLKKQLEAG